MSGDMGFGGYGGGRGYGAFSMPMLPGRGKVRGGFGGIGQMPGFLSRSMPVSPDYDQSRLFDGIGDPYEKASFRYGETGGEQDYGFPWTQENYNPNPQETQPAATQADEGNYQQQQGGPDSGDVAERNPGHHGKPFDQMTPQELRDYMEARNNDNLVQRNIERLNPSGLIGALFGRIEQSQLAAALNAAGLGGMNPGDYVDGKVAGAASTGMNVAGGVPNPELAGRSDPSQDGIGEANTATAGAAEANNDPNTARRGGAIRRNMGGIGYASGGLDQEDFAVRGIGDGRDDKIDALLSDGEHVIPADVVAAFGRGSSKAGHEKLNEMILKKRAQFKKTLGKLPPPKG